MNVQMLISSDIYRELVAPLDAISREEVHKYIQHFKEGGLINANNYFENRISLIIQDEIDPVLNKLVALLNS